MKVMLATPPYLWGATHPKFMVQSIPGSSPPTGILYIAAALRKAGHKVCFIDGIHADVGQIEALAKSFQPDLFGVGCVVNLWPAASALVSRIAAVVPELRTVAGGPGPNVLRERCFRECGELDYLVLGEGERTVVALANALENRHSLDSLTGIMIRADSGSITTRWNERPIDDLDALPYPAYDMIDIRRYRPSLGNYRRMPRVPVVASRGCPFDCSFCSRIVGRRIRFREPDACMEEIAFYVRNFRIKEISFNDEHFTIRRERVERFCDLFEQRRFDLTWLAAARVDAVDLEILRRMKQAGCVQIFFGVESGVQKNLDYIDKGSTLQRVKEAVRLTKEAGVSSMALYVLGIPGETPDEARETVSFAMELNTDYAEFFPLTPFPGTRLAEIASEVGEVDHDISRYNMHDIVFVPHSMTRGELESIRRSAYLRYCLRWRFIVLRWKSLRSLEDLAILAKGLRFVFDTSVQSLVSLLRSLRRGIRVRPWEVPAR